MSSVIFSSLQVLRSDASHKSRLNTPDDNLLVADITGQSLPTLEDPYFAWFDNACSLCHFPLPCTSPKQLDVNCDVVFFCAILRGEHDSVVRRGMPSEVDAR